MHWGSINDPWGHVATRMSPGPVCTPGVLSRPHPLHYYIIEKSDGLFWLETVYLRQCTEAVYEECHKNIQTPGQQLLSSKREQKIEQRCFCLKGLYFFWSLLVNLNRYQVSIRWKHWRSGLRIYIHMHSIEFKTLMKKAQ